MNSHTYPPWSIRHIKMMSFCQDVLVHLDVIKNSFNCSAINLTLSTITSYLYINSYTIVNSKKLEKTYISLRIPHYSINKINNRFDVQSYFAHL